MAIRPTQALLSEAFGESRIVGWISELRLTAGRQAGAVLKQIDISALGPVIAIRDETFFQQHPILLVIDPASLTILFAQVCADRQAETWCVALLMAQERGATIAGLVKDMATAYPKSQRLVEMEQVAVQKDPWHLQREGGWVRQRLEKAAYCAMASVRKIRVQTLLHPSLPLLTVKIAFAVGKPFCYNFCWLLVHRWWALFSALITIQRSFTAN